MTITAEEHEVEAEIAVAEAIAAEIDACEDEDD